MKQDQYKMPTHYPDAIKHYPYGMQIFIKKIVNRIDSGKNALIPILGPTGSGKSYAMISLMTGINLYMHNKIPTPEEISKHVIFKAKDLMVGLNEEGLKKKTVWGWDEAGIGIGHKEYMSANNKVIGWLVQTFRNLQQIVFLTVPSISFLDASVRKMLHYYLETVTIDKSHEMCIIKPLQMQYNPRMDKIYYHNLTFPGKNGFIEEVDVIPVPKPPIELCEVYELRSNEFKKDLRIKIESTLDKIDGKEEDKRTGNLKSELRKEDLIELCEQGYNSYKEMAKVLTITPNNLSKEIKETINEYNIQKILGKSRIFPRILDVPTS